MYSLLFPWGGVRWVEWGGERSRLLNHFRGGKRKLGTCTLALNKQKALFLASAVQVRTRNLSKVLL